MNIEIFSQSDANRLLKNKKILMLGDSNLRGLYKDLLWLCKRSTIIHNSALKIKNEKSYLNDRLLTSGKLHNGLGYEEVRMFVDINLHLEFHFLTSCFNEHFKQLLYRIKETNVSAPDVVILNSCMWDVTRWGSESVELYKKNVIRAMKSLKQCLPSKTVVIWATALPPSFEAVGGFLIEKIQHLRSMLRWQLLEANSFVAECAKYFDYEIMDFHYYMQMQVHRRQRDGIHWKPEAMRHLTNMFLSHISHKLNLPLPQNTPLCINVNYNYKQKPKKSGRGFAMKRKSTIQCTTPFKRRKMNSEMNFACDEYDYNFETPTRPGPIFDNSICDYSFEITFFDFEKNGYVNM